MQEQNSSKREAESIMMLQKLIRVDSKDCNFHFRDLWRGFYFKVTYQQTNTDNHSNDVLLRQFWHHVYAHYFKKIELDEIRRIDYLKSFVAGGASTGQSVGAATLPLFARHPFFQQNMHSVFAQSYLSKLKEEAQMDKQTELFLSKLLLASKMEGLAQILSKQRKKGVKGIYSKLKQNREQRTKIKNSKLKKDAIRKDIKGVVSLLQNLEEEEQLHMTEIDLEIQKLQRQSSHHEEYLEEHIGKLEGKIEAENDMIENRAYSRNIIYASGKSKDMDKDLQCLEYLIDCLEEKQIAESIAKIISTQRSNGEPMFKIDYEKAMNIEPKLIGEKELFRMNFLRETSLINFYRTGVKSLFSYICHNYIGFRELMQNRATITPKLKDKDMIQMMKKGAFLASVGSIQQEMSKFNMCHHCKFLYQDHMLFTCKFASDKQAIPKMNIDASCDPNLAEDFQEGPHRNRTSQRFMTRKKNCLTSYAKIHDEYVCGRKYCLSCLKDTYAQENIRQTGLCPFCLGVCMCTRCLRNQKIAKFKTMFCMLGGELTDLQSKSMLDHIQVKNDEQIPRGRGRPKKYMISHISVNSTKKKLRRFGEKQNHCFNLSIQQQMVKKGKRVKPIFTAEKKNDSGNETQDENQPKKVKRGVGRPRLDKKKQAQ